MLPSPFPFQFSLFSLPFYSIITFTSRSLERLHILFLRPCFILPLSSPFFVFFIAFSLFLRSVYSSLLHVFIPCPFVSTYVPSSFPPSYSLILLLPLFLHTQFSSLLPRLLSRFLSHYPPSTASLVQPDASPLPPPHRSFLDNYPAFASSSPLLPFFLLPSSFFCVPKLIHPVKPFCA